MNFHKPRERIGPDGKGSGVWDYTNYNDNQKAFYREGYCAGWPSWCDEPYDPEKDQWFTSWYSDQASKEAYVAKRYAPFKHKFHSNGHASAEECYACRKAYDLDFNTQFHDDLESPDQLNKCHAPGCSAFTSGQAWVGGYWTKFLCKEHRTRETVEMLYDVGDSYGSS